MMPLLGILSSGKRNQIDDLDELSKSISSLAPRVLGLLNEALKSDIPSIRARARNILKELE